MSTNTIGQYQLLAKFSGGESRKLYRARDESTGQIVTIWMLSDDIPWDPALRERFRRECQCAASLQHPRILRLLSFGEWEGTVYSVTEPCSGQPLENLIARQAPLSIEKKVAIIVQAAEALSHAHAREILHSALNPRSIYLLAEGNAKIRDFGVARFLSSCGRPDAPPASAASYLSPEQIQGSPPDARSDIFSLGLIFYELLTYHHPFRHADPARTRDQILHRVTFPTVDQFGELPLGLWPILERCLAKLPDERYNSVEEMLAACRQLQKDIADDRQLMLVELHTVLPRLAEAAQRPGAPGVLKELQQEVEELLSSEQTAEYLPLDRLLSALAEHCRAIHAGSEQPTPPSPQDGDPAAFLPLSPQDGTEAEALAADMGAVSPLGSPEGASPQAPLPEAPAAVAQEGSSVSEVFAESESSTPAESWPETQTHTAGESETQANLQELAAALSDDASALPESECPGSLDSSPAPAPESDEPPGDPPGAAARPLLQRRQLVVAALIVLGLATVGAVACWLQGRFSSQRGLFVVASDAFEGALRRLTGRTGGAVYTRTAGSPVAVRAASLPRGSAETVPHVLTEQARLLLEQKRYDESRVFLNRALELAPGYEPAAEELQVLEAAAGGAGSSSRREEMVQTYLANAATWIVAGKLRQARLELDRVDRIAPGLPDTRSLRQKWEQKNQELVAEQERQQAAQVEAERRQQALTQWAGQSQELFAQGNYGEARAVLERLLADKPGDPETQGLYSRAAVALRSLGLYESAMNSRRYQEAGDALSSLERANPADPRLADMRGRLERRRAVATASLSIYRLHAPGTLMIDGQEVGANGELVNLPLGIGSHRIVLRTESGAQATQTQEFLEGQSVYYVYDATLPVLRPMMESDRALISERKTKEEVHTFPVEHVHGVLRGSCSGELLVSFYDVTYKPAAGSHGFSVPFRNVRLRVEDRTLRIILASGSRELVQLRAQDAESAAAVAQLWGRLKALER